MIAALISSAVFLGIFILVVIGNPWIDGEISQKVTLLLNDSISNFFISMSNQFGKILFGLMVLAALKLYSMDRKKESLVLVSSVVGGYILGNLVKFVVQRPRPLLSAIQETGYSFPSNHAVVAAVLFLMIIYFFAGEIKNNLAKNAFILVNFLLILLFGFSRIYLNVHWFTDIVGGFVLGVFIVSVAILFLKSLNTCAQK